VCRELGFAIDLPPHRGVVAATNRINQIARMLRTVAEPRIMDRLRADVSSGVVEGVTRLAAAGPG